MEAPEIRNDPDEIRGHRRTLLDGLRYHGGSAHTSALRSYGDVPPGSIQYHLSVLEDWNLIEQDGTQRLDNGEIAHMYHLTEDGRDVAEEITQSTTTAENVESLEQQLSHQQDQIDALQENVTALQQQIEELNELRDEFNRMADVVEDLARQKSEGSS
jgi:DNA-binding PadR family transcriptional regulator